MVRSFVRLSVTTKGAAVASSSLLALAAGLGWSGNASAAGTCGAPNSGGTVNCAKKTYASGIEYSGVSSVDDLTVNVGSFAGQKHAVSVNGGITVESAFTSSDATSEALNVGSNVTIVAGTSYGDNAISLGASSYNQSATATLSNSAGLTAVDGEGISVGASIYNAIGTQTATATVTNSGDIHSYGFGIYAAATGYASATSSTVSNSGAIVSGGGIFNWAHTKNDSFYGAALGTAYATINNTGSITGHASGLTNFAVSLVYGGTSASAASVSTVNNSGAIKTTGNTATGYVDAPTAIDATATAEATAAGSATANASVTVSNSGAISTIGMYGSGIYARSTSSAFSYGTSAASATSQASVQNSGGITTTGDHAAGISNFALSSTAFGQEAESHAYATTTNSGEISASGERTDAINSGSTASAQGVAAAATASTYVENSGRLTSSFGGTAIEAMSLAYSYFDTVSGAATGTTSVKNSGAIETDALAYAAGIVARTKVTTKGRLYQGDQIATATSSITNSGSVTTTGPASTAIYSGAISYAGKSLYAYNATSDSTATLTNSGVIVTGGAGVSNYLEGAFGLIVTAFSYAAGANSAHTTAHAIIVNTGTVSTESDIGFGIAAGATGISRSVGKAYSSSYANITNNAAVSTAGYYAQAIRVIAESTALGTDAYSIATAAAANSGALTTQGVFAPAIYALSVASANSLDPLTTVSAIAATTVNNSGRIVTSGDGSAGVNAQSYAEGGLHSASGGSPYISSATATTIVNNSASISTAGEVGGVYHRSYADGIYAGASTKTYGFRNSYATSVVSVTNSGTIATSGDHSKGIDVVAQSSAYGARGCIQCFASGYSIGRSYGTVTNSGAITTTGGSAAAISVTTTGSGTFKFGSYSYDQSVVNNSGALKTTGPASEGISAVSNGYGPFEYFSIANVSTTAAVTNSGSISTAGVGSSGIYTGAFAVASGLQHSAAYANAFIDNSGDIAVTGDETLDIQLSSEAISTQGNGFVHSVGYVTNSGTLTASGKYSGGIQSVVRGYSARSTGTYTSAIGQVLAISVIGNSGSITTAGTLSYGISTIAVANATSYYYSSATANATISNSGTIKTTGDYSNAIVASAGAFNFTRPGSYYWSQATVSTTVHNSGTISVSGAKAAGISAASYALAVGASTATASATTSVINSGSISASAQYVDGISASSIALVKKGGGDGTATATTYVANTGIITAQSGTGIVASASTYDFGASPGAAGSGATTASVLVKNGGMIVAGEEGIDALAAFEGGGGISTISITATVQNAGAITVTGNYGTGISALTTGVVPGTVTVENAGSVTVLGTKAVGVAVGSYAATVVNAAGGAIVASGAGSVGVSMGGAKNVLVTYSGSRISGGTGTGGAGVYMNGGLNTVSNAGTITAGNDAAISMTGLYANIVKNTGTITGMVAMTTGAGQNVLYNYGTWNAAGGDSSFIHGAGGGSNLVNEKGGTIVVIGSQTFAGLDKFTNLGTVNMTQAASGSIGARPPFETLTISGDYESIGGTLAVDASTQGGMQGDELLIEGAASGTTNVKPTILGTRGRTTGNGILLVSAASGASANEFVIAGNAANGDEVAGGFEYNLAFVPGSGTAGDWYLQSQIYPGVYQFGQTQSSALLVSDQVNPSLEGLMNQAFDNTARTASFDSTSQQVASADSSFVPPPNSGAPLSGWGRFDESRFNVNPNGSPFAAYKLRVEALQMGLDGTWHNADNVVMFGGYLTPFHASSDFASFGGHIGMSGTAYGIYGLWFNGPWAAGLRLNTDNGTAHISDAFIGTDASVKPYERGAQAAVSYDMPLDWADFTPSAEFNYGTVNGVHFTDGVGDLVHLSSTDDVWGKLNGRFSWNVETAHDLLVQPYVNLGLLYRGDSATRTTIGAFSTATNVNGWDGDFAGGVNTNLAANLSLSAQVDYLAGNRVKGWTGFIGLRYTP